jgi:hypothetical protein
MSTHSNHKFSITIHSADLAVVHCLRALSQYCQKTGNARITWGNTKEADWISIGHDVTFRFTNLAYRDDSIRELERLIPKQLWNITSTNKNDPANPAN